MYTHLIKASLISFQPPLLHRRDTHHFFFLTPGNSSIIFWGVRGVGQDRPLHETPSLTKFPPPKSDLAPKQFLGWRGRPDKQASSFRIDKRYLFLYHKEYNFFSCIRPRVESEQAKITIWGCCARWRGTSTACWASGAVGAQSSYLLLQLLICSDLDHFSETRGGAATASRAHCPETVAEPGCTVENSTPAGPAASSCCSSARAWNADLNHTKIHR